MREIKFRGLFDKNKWVYGVPIFSDNKELAYLLNDECEMVVKGNTIGQFTGLFDRSGVEIYEGDICKTHDQINIVEFKEGNFRLIGQHVDKYQRNYDLISYHMLDGTLRNLENSKFDGITTTIEVIGNIYENKELLNGKEDN